MTTRSCKHNIILIINKNNIIHKLTFVKITTNIFIINEEYILLLYKEDYNNNIYSSLYKRVYNENKHFSLFKMIYDDTKYLCDV